MTDTELKEIEARAEAATPGPWGYRPFCLTAEGKTISHMDEYYQGDLEFIAHARTDIPALVAEVRRLREKCGESCPEGTAIYHVSTNEFVLCPDCGCEIVDPWDEPGTKVCDGGDWHGVITCRNCEAKIEVRSQFTHFWTARLHDGKERLVMTTTPTTTISQEERIELVRIDMLALRAGADTIIDAGKVSSLVNALTTVESELSECRLFIKGVCDAAEEAHWGIQDNQEYDPEQRGRDMVRIPLSHAVEAAETRAKKAERANSQCTQLAEYLCDLAIQGQQRRRKAEATLRDVLARLERIHIACTDTRPKQAVGEMIYALLLEMKEKKEWF